MTLACARTQPVAGRRTVRLPPPLRAAPWDREDAQPTLPAAGRAVDTGAVIPEVGRALHTLLRPQVPASAAIHLGQPVDPPAGVLAANGAGPAVHLVLCWLRADPNGQQSGDTDVRAEDGSLLGRQAPARRYELRYLVTARAESAEAEHELLDAVLLAVTGLDALPAECLPNDLADTGLAVFLQVCAEPALASSGIPAHAGFELNVSAPLLPPLQTELAPPAAELSVGVRRPMPQRPAPLSPQPTAAGGRQWRRAKVAEDEDPGTAAAAAPAAAPAAGSVPVRASGTARE